MARLVQHSIALGLLAVGLVFGILGLFLNWWAVDVEFGPMGDTVFEARPYSSEAQDDVEADFDSTLDGHVIAAGILVTVSLVAMLTAIGLLIGAFFSTAIRPILAHLPSMVALVLALVAVILAPATWPGAFKDDFVPDDEDAQSSVNVSWFGDWKQSFGGESIRIDYKPGIGWFFTGIGLVVLPSAALLTHFWPDPRPRTEPKREYLDVQGGSAPPLPTMQSFDASPPPQPGTGARVTQSTAVKRRKSTRKE